MKDTIKEIHTEIGGVIILGIDSYTNTPLYLADSPTDEGRVKFTTTSLDVALLFHNKKDNPVIIDMINRIKAYHKDKFHPIVAQVRIKNTMTIDKSELIDLKKI